jgi:hypothetical protein
LHRRALRLLESTGGRPPLFRPPSLDGLRRAKAAFMASQRRVPRRLANYLVYRAERGRVARVRYFPPMGVVESSRGCNLRCPRCATGLGLIPAKRTPKALFEAVVDQSCERSFQLGLHQEGEPLLNPAFFDGCAYAVDRGLWTVAHSNLSFEIPHLAERLVDCRLGNLVVSCDGATQPVYAEYRRGGDVELVFANLRRVVAERARRRRSLPWITAKFIVFDHNWHEMEAFRARALDAGADDVLFVAGLADGPYSTGRAATERIFELATLTWRPRPLGASCMDLWDGLHVDPGGVVTPCCYATARDAFILVDGGPLELARVWNGDAYVRMRRHMLGERLDPAAMPRPCDACGYTRR